MSAAAALGEEALKSSNAPLAIQHYTRALTQLPRAVNYYLQRSIAHSRVKPADGGPKSNAALRDAEIALALAVQRGRREMILAAQMRRGIALFQLEQYGDANFIFELVESKAADERAPKDQNTLATAMGGGSKKNGYDAEAPIWLMKVRRKLGELAEGDQRAVVSVAEYPRDTHIPTEEELVAELNGLGIEKSTPAANVSKKRDSLPTSSAASAPSKSTSETTAEKPAIGPAPSDKIRHEWYQSRDSVVVTLYIKGVPKESVQTELQEQSVSLQFPLPSGSEYDFSLDPLYGPIDPTTSKASVMSTKIEVVLTKRTPGQKWGALESSSADTTKFSDRPALPPAPAASGPAYPTSSRHGARDWDKVASSLESKGKQKVTDNAGDNSDAESVDSEYGGDAVDGFFKKLYAGADDDTRRAMMKSFIESQGTSLSTNWSEVGSKNMAMHKDSD
ncbi:hypothetical protein N7532_006561 [Penicillium argentinense]|uniref:SGT1 and CS domain protein n=1 Tax=Penicillium argentinense TaxID=1131581 RepID=A0A9W9FG16_9EURO|nr:uncharacterized protein N7532_006561 [Penicillium argentinense]KAJ5099560.1 hypothetical protein N7532_006561 [Penicillium argentinense]